MQYLALIASVATAVSALPQYQATYPQVNLTGIYLCGNQSFYPTNYTCYSNTYLCPVVDNRRQVACGSACYDPSIYGCVNGQLQQVLNGTLIPSGVMANTTADPLGIYGGTNVTLTPSGMPMARVRRS